MVQYKVFKDGKNEGNRTNMVVLIDRERGIRWDVSAKCQASLASLCYYTIVE